MAFLSWHCMKTGRNRSCFKQHIHSVTWLNLFQPQIPWMFLFHMDLTRLTEIWELYWEHFSCSFSGSKKTPWGSESFQFTVKGLIIWLSSTNQARFQHLMAWIFLFGARVHLVNQLQPYVSSNGKRWGVFSHTNDNGTLAAGKFEKNPQGLWSMDPGWRCISYGTCGYSTATAMLV